MEKPLLCTLVHHQHANPGAKQHRLDQIWCDAFKFAIGDCILEVIDPQNLQPSDDRSLVRLAHRNGVRLLKLVNTLLDFSRIEAGRVQASFQPVDLAVFTAELASNFRSAIERAGLRLVIECPSLPQQVYVDADMWEKVVLNLISNAFKFTFEGEIAITAKLSSDGRCAEVTVRDTGTGIPTEELSHLFERFHRVEGARGRSIEGSGIGLALVQELVRLHGGTIHVSSEVGHGSVFTVAIPFGAGHLPADQIGRGQAMGTASVRPQAYVEEALGWFSDGGTSTPGPLPSPASEELGDVSAIAGCEGQLVLVADDNADMRNYVERLLRASGFRVEAVTDGKKALAAARRLKPDLVLSDVMMPELDGFGLLTAVRKDSELRDTPVLLLSARAGEEAKVEGLSAGADDYLIKPFSARELLARVGVKLQLARKRRERSERELRQVTTERKQAEEALRRSERRWQTAFENSAIGMMMRDCSDRFVASNSVFQNMLGYTESELSQLTSEDVTYDEDCSANLELIRELLEGRRQHFQIEKRYRRKDGTLLWARNNVALIPGIADAAPFLFAVVEDITQRKQEESARRYSEERYRIVVETASDAVVSIDETSTILFVNPATSRIFGYDASELIGQPLTTLMPDYKRELHKAGFKRYLDTAERHINWQGTELIALRKNNKEFPVEVSFGELAINGRRLFTGFIRDISERKQAEENIRQSEKELRQLLDFTPQHVTVLGPDGRRLYSNQAALDYHGLTLEEWQNADPDRLFHPQDRERLTREVDSKFLSGYSLDIEVRLRRRDGQYHWFLIRYNPTLDEHGRPTRWYAAATDIEDRKQAEQRLENENVALREEIDKTSMFEEIVGISPALRAVLSRVSKVAPTDSTVLITGETGTGKELIARAVHKRSQRFSRAFVGVNCAAIPHDLIASELFGHEKGAFTGATQRRLGRFELAEGGTIFLDEIGELPGETQIALLRVLQEHEFERVGGTGTIQTDVRVIAATNRDLEAAITAGTFRSDLFYRLNVFPIEVPSLRERKEDIPVLVEYFIDRYASKAGKSIRGINKESLKLLQSYPWPGNIRELQNVIERSVIVCDTENFSIDESWLSRRPLTSEPKTQLTLAREPLKEREIIEAALRESGGRVYGPSGAASKLGIPRSTLESKIKLLNISKSRFKAIDSSKNS